MLGNSRQLPAQPSFAPAPSNVSLAGGRKEQVLVRVRSNPELPTPPAIAFQIIEKASDPDCEIDDLVAVITNDPALCAKVLRTVNSALYGLRRPVSSVPAAIRFLGIHPLRSLVLAFTLANLRWLPLPPDVLQTYWRVSVAGAIAARQLSALLGRTAPDNDLVAGLVRDLGILVLHQLFPAEYQSILSTSPEVLSGFQCELEEDQFGVSHAEASAELLRTWRLPEEITEPVRHHHDWARASQLPEEVRDRAQLLYFASQIGQMQMTPNRPMLVREVLTLAHEHFGMDDDALRTYLGTVQDQMNEFASVLNVDIGDGLTFSAVMSRGAEELARLAVSGTGSLVPWANPAGGTEVNGLSDEPTRPGKKLLGPQPTAVPQAPAARASDDTEGSAEELLARLFPGPARPGLLGVMDGYEVTELLGCGAMGAVFRATDTRLQRTVAIKAMLPHLASQGQARARFLREGQAIANLTHENIVRVHTVGEVNAIPYLVMEYVKGTSLEARLEAAPLELPAILRIGVDAGGGLAAAHAAGLVHRDVKPANLLWDEAHGRIKVADFGLVYGTGQAHLTQNGGLVGTPTFMAPEQADGQPVGPPSDMFSLGCVLYVACTGRLPFPGNTLSPVLRALFDCCPPPVRTINPDLPPWLEEIIAGLLAKDPARRFPTATELKRLFLCRWARLYTRRKVVG